VVILYWYRPFHCRYQITFISIVNSRGIDPEALIFQKVLLPPALPERADPGPARPGSHRPAQTRALSRNCRGGQYCDPRAQRLQRFQRGTGRGDDYSGDGDNIIF